MKKLFYTVAAVFLTCFPTLSAQDNLLANPGFEEWNEGTLQGAWTATDNITLTQEATTKLNGNYALRLETAANSDLYAVGSFKQDVTGTFQQGEVYEVSISFYTVSNGGSTFNRLRLNHRWDNYADPTEPYYQSYEMPVGQWSTQTAEVPVANEGASTFNFIMQTDPGTILIVDDFSFRKKEGASTPYLTVDPARFPTVETTVGTPVEIGKATLYYGNLPVELSEAAGTLYIGGTHKDQFGMKVTRNEPGEMELTLTYAPTKPTTYGMHTARITIDPQVEGLTASISLSGVASEPGLNPVITVGRSTVKITESYPATIRGRQDVEIYPQVSGKITRMAVTEGERVRKGQTLFVIDQVPYQAALQTAEANVEAARAAVATAQLTYEGKRQLFEQDVISQFELSTAENALLTAKAQEAQAEAQELSARNNLSYTTITSPTDGVVGTIPYRAGALVSSSSASPLTTVSDNSVMHVYFSLPESPFTISATYCRSRVGSF